MTSKNRLATTLIELVICISLLSVLMAMLFPAIQSARESARAMECSHRMRQLSLSLISFESAYRKLPPGTEISHFRPFQTWAAKTLPYLESKPLWQSIESAYSSPRVFDVEAHPLSQIAIAGFACPSDLKADRPQFYVPSQRLVGLMSYVGVSGTSHANRDGALFGASEVRLRDVTDGLSQTWLLGERPPSLDNRFGWWYAGTGADGFGTLDATLGMNQQVSGLRGVPACTGAMRGVATAQPQSFCDCIHFWSYHAGGAYFARLDGSVAYVSNHVDPIVMQSMATIHSGESVSLD